MARAPLTWLLVFAGWTLLALVSSTQIYVIEPRFGHPVPWRWAVRLPLLQYWFWAAATPLVLWLARRFPLRGRDDLRNAGIHAGASLGISLVYSLYRIPFHSFVYPPSYSPPAPAPQLFRLYFVGNIVENAWLYGALLAVGLALEYFSRYRSREVTAMSLKAELAEARLQVLRAQLQPHFLFNALNTIASFIPEQPELAQDLMADLSEMLRRSLDGASVHEVTVDDELGLLEPYVRIQRSRFSDRLLFAIRVADEARAAYLPGMMLQTLVENAVRHGVSRVEGRGEVSIDISREGHRLVSRVADTGPGLGIPPEAALNRGIGLQNVRSRLEALYGDDYGLQFDSTEPGGLRVTISIPFHTTPAAGMAGLPRAE